MPLPVPSGFAPPAGIGPTLIDPNWLRSAPTFTNLILSGLLYESAATGIIASTTRTQAGATPLTLEVNRVDTSTAPAAGTVLGDGVMLMAATAGLDIAIINNTINIITVYGAGSDTINGVASSVGIPMPPGDVAQFESAGAGVWNFEAGVGASGALAVQLAASGISAAGANQVSATPLPADFNRISAATTNQGVRLPPATVAGLDIVVSNKSGAQIVVYGNGTDTIDGNAGSVGVAQMYNSVTFFFSTAPGVWETEGLATGFAPSGLQTVQFLDNITAAGTTQGTGTPITGQINTVANVAAGTGVNLPVGAPGLAVTVINNGANALIVYPAQSSSDTINGFAASAGLSLSVGAEATFNQTALGAWTAASATTKNASYNASASAVSFTASGAQITGGSAFVELDLTGNPAGAANVTLPTVAQMVAAMHSPLPGSSFELRVKNSANSAGWTIVTSTGWTLNGTMSIATTTWRDFVITVNSTSTATIQNAGGGNVL